MNLRRRLDSLPARMRSIFQRARTERDLDEELSFHLTMQTRAAEEQGLSRAEAERRARLDLNGLQQTKERSRDMWPFGWVDDFRQDVRYAIRTLSGNPAFASVAVLTLALGIGANTAIFSAVHSILLRPLPYQQPDRLVMVWEDASWISFPRNTPAPANYFDWKTQNHSFTEIAATLGSTRNLTVDGPPQQVIGRSVTANFFSVLGVTPMLGRAFTEEEDATGAQVVLISYRLWQTRYASDPGITGRPLLMNGASHTIIGVMARDFVFRNREIDFWVPIHFPPALAANRNFHALNVVARLRPDVSLQQAAEDMNAVAHDLAVKYPDSNGRVGAVVVPLSEELLGDTRLQLLVLMGAAGCVLLIACANLASLLMSRALRRRGELATRVALGASRTRLVQQLVVEALLLAVAGGTFGLILAPAGTRVLTELVPPTLLVPTITVVSLPLLAFTLGVSLVTAVLFSLVPALQAARGSLHDSLQQVGRGGSSDGGGRSRLTRDALIVVQVAVSVVLLVSAGLMLRTLANLRALDLGFEADRLLTMQVAISPQKYADAVSRSTFYNRLIDGVRTLPGVEGAAAVTTLPFLSQGTTAGYQLEGQPREQGRDALFRATAGDYLQTLGVRLVEGRPLDASDTVDATKVMVVNETLARRHWPTESALGHRLVLEFGVTGPQLHTIVGVVKDVRERGYTLEMKPGMYIPSAQIPAYPIPGNLVVRLSDAALAPAAAIRRVVAEIDPEQPVAGVRSMNEIVDLAVADRRQQLTLLGVFAGLALLLAACGLYGMLAYAVTRRRQEIGLRIALGASAGSVMRLVLSRGLAVTFVGLAVGVALAFGVTRAMTTLLYGVGTTDAATFGSVIALLMLVALTACALPAFRAARVNPMRVLRQD